METRTINVAFAGYGEGDQMPERPPNIFAQRMFVWHDTKVAAAAFPITTPSVKYTLDETWERPAAAHETRVVVKNIDTIEAGQELLAAGRRPLLLNLADDRWAGGAVDGGSGAQEESLFRRTNYCATLLQIPALYPILPTEAVYSPGVTVFKATEAKGHERLAEPFQVDFLACPGIPYPQKTADGDLRPEDKAALEKKIELIFQVAAKAGHDSLVLGALGCGAWRNPPQTVAALFKAGVDRWSGVFRDVVFACLTVGEDGPLREGGRPTNYDVFRGALAAPYRRVPGYGSSPERG
jgi:uncharacterized protein (TIGR02452 family)